MNLVRGFTICQNAKRNLNGVFQLSYHAFINRPYNHAFAVQNIGRSWFSRLTTVPANNLTSILAFKFLNGPSSSAEASAGYFNKNSDNGKVESARWMMGPALYFSLSSQPPYDTKRPLRRREERLGVKIFVRLRRFRVNGATKRTSFPASYPGRSRFALSELQWEAWNQARSANFPDKLDR